MFKIEITAETPMDLVQQMHALTAQFGATALPDVPPAEDAPKARGRTAAKTTGKTDGGTASAATATDRPPLVADEAQQADPAAVTQQGNASSVDTAAASDDKPAEPTQEDKDALLRDATKFSQDHGHDALLAALKAVGAERFSAIPFEKYQAFRDAMAKASAGASALS